MPGVDETSGEWYWCLRHERVEPRAGCREEDRMGPYPTREAAEHWKDTLATRNEQWEREDREWEEGPTS
jgi:hypothetical protein